ncbi:hypothetical protein MA16_Dca019079 [Dendrobium catenatum]|uniref:Uncharacterized protein n=1 Tax=Dendrobium catenatum TaxID=906689 RepID=A0A2I0VU78_9ASPA|nr:hypothetical protein MA16_Dca019079 [Dendrobium catenatum]
MLRGRDVFHSFFACSPLLIELFRDYVAFEDLNRWVTSLRLQCGEYHPLESFIAPLSWGTCDVLEPAADITEPIGHSRLLGHRQLQAAPLEWPRDSIVRQKKHLSTVGVSLHNPFGLGLQFGIMLSEETGEPTSTSDCASLGLSGVIEDLVLVGFLGTWLCTFILLVRTGSLRCSVLLVASQLAQGQRLSFFPIILSKVYRVLRTLSEVSSLEVGATVTLEGYQPNRVSKQFRLGTGSSFLLAQPSSCTGIRIDTEDHITTGAVVPSSARASDVAPDPPHAETARPSHRCVGSQRAGAGLLLKFLETLSYVPMTSDLVLVEFFFFPECTQTGATGPSSVPSGYSTDSASPSIVLEGVDYTLEILCLIPLPVSSRSIERCSHTIELLRDLISNIDPRSPDLGLCLFLLLIDSLGYLPILEATLPELEERVALRRGLVDEIHDRQRSPYNTPFHQPGVAECQTLFSPSWRWKRTFSFFSLLEKAEYLKVTDIEEPFPMEILPQILLGPQEEQDAASSEQPCDLPHSSSPSQRSPSPSSLKP